MTLDQLDRLRLWYRHHGGHHVEYGVWNAVLTLWLAAWVGEPIAWLLKADDAALAALPLLFAPGVYVRWRRRLHSRGRLRCDWIGALR